jgi:hypothetical protein
VLGIQSCSIEIGDKRTRTLSTLAKFVNLGFASEEFKPIDSQILELTTQIFVIDEKVHIMKKGCFPIDLST